MFNRAEVVDQNFTEFVTKKIFPDETVHITPASIGLSNENFIDLFESQMMSRHLDFRSRILKQDNQSYYTIGSSGHEGNAVLGKAFRYTDMAFLHYRSCALLMQRSKQLPESTPLYDTLLSFVASKEDPISSGRHKVLGSKALFVPPQTSTIASHLPKAVGAAFSIGKDADFQKEMPDDSVVICNFGDASFNHSTAQGAINTAEWIAYRKIPCPVVFICDDNGIGISVSTPPKWVEERMKSVPAIKYIQCDGLNLADAYRGAQEAAEYARRTQMPVFLHMRTVRLLGHAGSDIETLYNPMARIESSEFQDPLLHSARIAIENEIMTDQDVLNMYESLRSRIQHIAEKVIVKPKLESAEEVMEDIIPPKQPILPPPLLEEDRKKLFGKNYDRIPKKKRNMSQLLNIALNDILLQYKNTVIFGEDVAKKGGVYHVTTSILENFGAKRIFNTLLDEQAILGTAIGMAHNGFLPIPEIQFLAYLHNAEDQIRGEAATLSFFSGGRFSNPMVIRIASYAYQRGFGGHFHNDNSIAVLRDIPGLIIASPSNGADAVKMLRACIEKAQFEKRVIAFLEPIALYMTKDLHEAGDEAWASHYPALEEKIDLDEIGVFGDGDDLTIITYSNGYFLSRQAEKVLKEEHGIHIKIIDLRWILPLPVNALINEVKHSKRVLIVEECRETGSLSEQLITTLVEHLDHLPKIKRYSGHDSFIPLGKAWEYVLPSKDGIIKHVLEMVKK